MVPRIISSYLIPKEFINLEGKCVSESYIENTFDNKIKILNPNVNIEKCRLGTGVTDGVISFLDNNHKLIFWTLQECKKDEGPTIINMAKAFLQSMMYLGGSILFDISPYFNIDKFKGIFLDSARYFCYISKEEILKYVNTFEPLYNKYYKDVQPSKAYYADELSDWAVMTIINIKKYVYRLDETFRLDNIIKDLYSNKI